MNHARTTFTPLYVQRSFGQKISDTFDFARRHWRVLLRFLTVLLLPVSVVQAVFLNSYVDLFGAADSDSAVVGALGSVGGLLLLSALGAMLVSAVVYGLMRLDQKRHGVFDALTFDEFRPELWRGVRRSLVLYGVFVLMGVVVVALLALSMEANLLFFLLLYLALLVAILPVLMLWPSYLLSDDDILGAVQAGWRYGWHTWGGIFATVFVMGMLVNVATSLLGIPYTICEMLRMLFVSDASASVLAFTDSPWFVLLTYLLAVGYVLISYLGYALLSIALGYQYGHAAEKLDGVSVMIDTEYFDNLDVDAPKRTLFDDIDDFERL